MSLCIHNCCTARKPPTITARLAKAKHELAYWPVGEDKELYSHTLEYFKEYLKADIINA